jgi:hypothetical protein
VIVVFSFCVISYILCVVLCTVFRLIVVLFCVMLVVCVLCLIVVPLPPGENPYAVKINNIDKIFYFMKTFGGVEL